jgi:hypothetical protein
MAGGGPFRVILKTVPAADGFGCPPDPIEAEWEAAITRVARPTGGHNVVGDETERLTSANLGQRRHLAASVEIL